MTKILLLHESLYVFGEPHHMTFYMNMNYPKKK